MRDIVLGSNPVSGAASKEFLACRTWVHTEESLEATVFTLWDRFCFSRPLFTHNSEMWKNSTSSSLRNLFHSWITIIWVVGCQGKQSPEGDGGDKRDDSSKEIDWVPKPTGSAEKEVGPPPSGILCRVVGRMDSFQFVLWRWSIFGAFVLPMVLWHMYPIKDFGGDILPRVIWQLLWYLPVLRQPDVVCKFELQGRLLQIA